MTLLTWAVATSLFVGPQVGLGMSEDEPSHRSRRDRAMDAIEAKNFDAARDLIRKGMRERSSRRKDEWRIIEVRLLLADGQPKTAGLHAMRMVSLRPKSKQYAAALFLAGNAYEEIGRPSVSRTVYEEALAHETCTGGLRRAVESRLERLTENE